MKVYVIFCVESSNDSEVKFAANVLKTFKQREDALKYRDQLRERFNHYNDGVTRTVEIYEMDVE